MKQKDLCLVPFPFSNLKGHKVRPVLVVSNNTFNKNSQDIIVCGVTSQRVAQSIPLSKENMAEGQLYSKSYIKPSQIVKIHQELIIKKIGAVDDYVLSKTKNAIMKLL